MDDYLLTVWCETYNFSDYLRDTLDGFLAQKTDFKFQVFVYDDASTDSSSEIIHEYMDKYPDIIKGYVSDFNTYGKPVRHELIKKLKEENVKGKYYALCEGDDYWIDPLKLQKQVDFLENNPDCSLTIHAAHVINCDDGTEYDFHPYHESRYLTDEEIILQTGGNPPTASYVYRINDIWDHQMDSIFKVSHAGDVALQLYELMEGKIYYFDDVMSVYRYKHNSSWTNKYISDYCYKIEHYYDMRDFYHRYNVYTDYKYSKYIEIMYKHYLLDRVLLDTDVSMDEYLDILNKCNIPEVEKKKYIDEKVRIGCLYRGKYSFNAKEREMIEKCDKVVIYGCGKVAEIIEKNLNNNNIDFSGYLVSEEQCIINDKKRKVWRVNEYPYSYDSTCVFVGLSQMNEIKIRDVFKKYNITHVIDLIWLNINNK